MSVPLVLENERIRLELLPHRGGKITSLRDKRTGGEWLYQGDDVGETGRSFVGLSPGPEACPPFTEEESYGFDEMFPTIIPQTWETPGGEPVHDPDHGCLWSRPWKPEDRNITGSNRHEIALRLTDSVRKWSFSRTIMLKGNRLRMSYSVINQASWKIPALWAAHPLFSYFDETAIIFPESMKRIRQAMDDPWLLGAFGTVSPLSRLFVDGDAREQPLLFRPSAVPRGRCLKWYNADPLDAGRLAIQDRRGSLLFFFPVETLPWVGFWINRGGWGGQHNLAIEPATAPMDSPEKAGQFGYQAWWNPGETRQWSVELVVECP